MGSGKDAAVDVVEATAAPPRSSELIRRLTLLGFAVALLLPALGVVMLMGTRDDVRRDAEQASANLAIALERDIARNLMSLDLSVQGAIDASKLPGIADISPELRHTALFDRAATAEYLGSLLVLDRTGKVTASSTDTGLNIELGDRDYFQVHRDGTAAGLFLSLPYKSRLRKGDASIAVSRRVDGPDGRFDGVVMGALRLSYFDHLFGTLQLGLHGMVSLARTDGIMLARRPSAADADLGRDVSGSPAFQKMTARQAGHFRDTSRIDGVERLYAFRRIGDLPLVLTVALASEDIYAGWWRKALVIGSVLLALSAATAMLCLLFRREMVRRLSAQQALMEIAQRLRVMASTDSLTGLSNRRSFEDALDMEWRRAVRQETELAVLMIDADFFKAYNDLYGHPAGDKALQQLAGALQASARRPADWVARIGGEEFVALLPDTGLEGGSTMAERIRREVGELAILHAGSPYGRMTFSIGIASLHPDDEGDPGKLLKLADDAMYRAKAAGRDRVVVAGLADAAG